MAGALRIVQGSWEHVLAVALRFDDHFLGGPVAEVLDVSLAAASGRALRPISSPTPGVSRQADGTYRYADLADGHYPVSYASPSGDWLSWDPPLTVALPLAPAAKLVVRQLWPAPQALVPGGQTAVRGKLAGANVSGLMVEITGQGMAFDGRFNRASSTGEVLYPIVFTAPVTVTGRVQLTARVASGARTVGREPTPVEAESRS